jgi:hypothetical protein
VECVQVVRLSQSGFKIHRPALSIQIPRKQWTQEKTTFKWQNPAWFEASGVRSELQNIFYGLFLFRQ